MSTTSKRDASGAAIASAKDVDTATEETISDEQASRLIEEFESESPTRRVLGPWKLIVGLLCVALAVYALYWTQFGIVTQVYRASFLLLTLALTFLLYPAFSSDYARPNARGLLIRGGATLVAIALIVNWARGFESARNLAIFTALLLFVAVYPVFKSLFVGRQGWLDAPLSLVGAVATGYVLARATDAWAGANLGVSGGTWQIALIVATLVVSAALYPLLRRSGDGRDRIALYDLHLTAISVASLAFLIFNYQSALQRITNPTPTELLLGGLAIALTLEATRRSTGWALPITALIFLFYAAYGSHLPDFLDTWIGHRGYRADRIIGQNFLTLEGMFGVPLDVAATFIVLFTIYGAVLEYSGAGKFFIDWSFAALGRSSGGTGPGRTVTAAGFLLGTVSGSGVATTVTLGSLAWPMLRRAGFNRDTAGGLLSAAGIGALLSPPTLGAAAFIIAEYLDVSYLRVLVYATIPTLLYYLSCLLMMEADSRRMRAQPVEFETPPLLELTLKYGYHFSSLFIIVILMGPLNQTPFMAVFWAIVAAFALSFLRPDTRMTSFWALGAGAALAAVLAVTGQRLSVAAFWGLILTAVIAAAIVAQARLRGVPPRAATSALAPGVENTRWLQALESGGRGTVSIASTTAAAGVIVSIVTLTGLGIKMSGIIVDLSNNVLFFTVIFAAIAVWVLGLAVPVTASYIIAAVMIVPALTQLGVEPAAAHMFIFYYAVLADVSPPTALAPFAAAAITGGSPFRTTMIAWKYCLPAFLVPFMFTLSPDGASLLMIGGVPTIIWTFITACVAVAALAITFGGWFIRRAAWPERILAGFAGLALLYADPRFDIAGFVLLGLAAAVHLLVTRGGPVAPTVALEGNRH
ncbi:MAG TPA: TRAP transporter fused permease subunit [Thermomicrobiales bacterium]|jgi:TRAP transporter 4TM/12TM fusion protein